MRLLLLLPLLIALHTEAVADKNPRMSPMVEAEVLYKNPDWDMRNRIAVADPAT